jgi:hypothetical protein
MTKQLLMLGFAFSLSACANTPAMRNLAAQTSSRVATQEASMNRFIQTGKQVNQDSAVTLATLQAQSAAQQAKTALTLEIWTLANKKDLLAAQAAVAKVQAADIVASSAVAQPALPALDDGGAGSSLEKASGAFTALAKKPGFLDMAREIFISGGAVYQAAHNLEQAAPSQPAKAATAPATSLTAPPKPAA